MNLLLILLLIDDRNELLKETTNDQPARQSLWAGVEGSQ